MDDVIRPSCRNAECPEPGIIAGWCPGHAIERYRRCAIRKDPERGLSGRERRREDEEA